MASLATDFTKSEFVILRMIMKKRSSAQILEAFNLYRKGEPWPKEWNAKPSEITLALDDAIAALQERDIARRVGVQQAGEIVRFRKALAEATRFRK